MTNVDKANGGRQQFATQQPDISLTWVNVFQADKSPFSREYFVYFWTVTQTAPTKTLSLSWAWQHDTNKRSIYKQQAIRAAAGVDCSS